MLMESPYHDRKQMCCKHISCGKNESGEKGKEDKKIYYALMQVNAAEIMKRQSNGKQAVIQLE